MKKIYFLITIISSFYFVQSGNAATLVNATISPQGVISNLTFTSDPLTPVYINIVANTSNAGGGTNATDIDGKLDWNVNLENYIWPGHYDDGTWTIYFFTGPNGFTNILNCQSDSTTCDTNANQKAVFYRNNGIWSTSNPIKDCCSNVAFLPGLEASRLYHDEQGSEVQLWEPNNNAEAQKLYMDSSGKSIDSIIYTKDIIDKGNSVPLYHPEIYDGFIKEMDGMVADTTITAWKALPYDWRMGVDDVVTSGVKYKDRWSFMVDDIVTLAQSSQTGKVTLIAHSNGGLVAKELMIELARRGKANLIDKVVMIAVPQLGTPRAIAALLHGEGADLGHGLVVDKQTGRAFAENMPGVYGLLPSEKYFQSVNDPIITFDQSVSSVNNFIGTYGSSITTKDILDKFLKGIDGRAKPAADKLSDPNIVNAALLSKANAIHSVIDNWVPSEGVKVIEVAGWGIDTLKGINYKGKSTCSTLLLLDTNCRKYLDYEPVITTEGDETVVYPSALSTSNNKYYLNMKLSNKDQDRGIDHKSILNSKPLQEFINKVITNNTNSLPQYITTSKPQLTSDDKEIRVSMHSPASIDLYDAQGRHTGPVVLSGTDLNYYEENIPGSYYMEFGEGKYAGFDTDTNSTVKIQGTGAGTFTFIVENVVADTVTNTTTFADIPVTPDTKASFDATAVTPTLNLDIDGNGTKDFTVNPGEEIDPILFLQMMDKTISTLGLPSQVQKQLSQKIEKAVKLITKDKKKQVASFIKRYSQQIESKKWKKSKQLTQEQKDTIVQLFTTLLDSIK